MANAYCTNCGCPLGEADQFCPNCGSPRTPNSSKQPSKHRRKAKIVVPILLVLALGIGIGLYWHITKVNTEKYFSALFDAMRLGGLETETAGNLVHDVWFNCIWETQDSETDKYTRSHNGSGAFYEDFNDALDCLYDDDDFLDDLDKIRLYKSSAELLMKELSKHPKSFDNEYNDFRDTYNSFIRFTNLVLLLDGSLSSFTDEFNELDKELANSMTALTIYLE